MATRKHTELSIKEKVELLKNSDRKSSRQLAEKHGVGHTQVQNLMKRKRESEFQCVLSSSKLVNKQTSIKSFFSLSPNCFACVCQ